MNAPERLPTPPSDNDAEQSIIGGLLIAPYAFDRIDWLPESAFYHADNREIFTALKTLIEAGVNADVLLTCSELQKRGTLDKVGGQAMVGALALNTPSAANIHKYAEIVRDKAMLRTMMGIGLEMQQQAQQIGVKPAEIVADVESRLNDVVAGRQESEAVEFHAALDQALKRREVGNVGLKTGFPDLNEILNPMKGGDLIVIAGRPSMGKSALALNLAEQVAQTEPVGFWSLEMGRASLAERILGWHEQRIGHDQALQKLSGLKLYIDVPSYLTVGGLRLRMKRVARKHGLKLAVIDYLQLMRGEGENRTQEIGSISRGLKRLAVEMDIPIITLCQLNRGVESRTEKRPMLSDLRESGDIEQDADAVLMLYRDEYYYPDSPARGSAEVLIRKQRDGQIGDVRLAFIPKHARFQNWAGGPIVYPSPAPKSRNGIAKISEKNSEKVRNYGSGD